MSTTTTSIAFALNALIEICKYDQEGFRAAADDVKKADNDFPTNIVSIIQRQFPGVQAAHDRVRDLPDRFPA